jgi:hypothetical protein
VSSDVSDRRPTGDSSRGRRATDARALVRHGARTAAGPLRAATVWAAVALPAAYLPLLLGGLDGPETVAFVALVVGHVLALVAGHGHGR